MRFMVLWMFMQRTRKAIISATRAISLGTFTDGRGTSSAECVTEPVSTNSAAIEYSPVTLEIANIKFIKVPRDEIGSGSSLDICSGCWNNH